MTKYDNSGILSENDRKQQPNHPDMKGSITIEGKEYWLSGWNKTGSKGAFISLSVKPKEAQDNFSQSRQAQQPSAFSEDLDESLPF